MTQQLQDQTLTCCERECGAQFIFTVGEQTFFASNSFTPPKRCKPCRDKRKADKNGGGMQTRQGTAPSAAAPEQSPPPRGGKKGGGKRGGRDEGGRRGGSYNDWD